MTVSFCCLSHLLCCSLPQQPWQTSTYFKSKRLLDRIKSDTCCLQEAHYNYKLTNRLKVKLWKEIYHANTNQKAGVTTLISDNMDFRTKQMNRNKEGHFVMIKVLVHQEVVTVIDFHASNNWASIYIVQELVGLQRQIAKLQSCRRFLFS